MPTATISGTRQPDAAESPRDDASNDVGRSERHGRPWSVHAGRVVSVRSVVRRFALAGFIALVIVCAVMAWVSDNVGDERAIGDARMVAQMSAQGIVAPRLHDDLIRGDVSAVSAMDDIIRTRVLGDSLVRVKIWTADGTIVYADDPRLIGERFELSEAQRAAFAAGAGQVGLNSLDEAENRYESESDLLEVYEPIETVEGTPLLFEAYLRHGDVSGAGRRLWGQFAPVAIAALLALELVQLALAWRMARRLRASQHERERLLRQAIGASELERRRIATDLHEGVVQDLTGVSFSLAALGQSTTADPAVVAEAERSIRSSITSLRSLLIEISPRELTDDGLEVAIGDLMVGLPARGIETALDVRLGGIDIDEDSALLAYRVVQEALRNAAGHSGATAVDVALTASDGQLNVVVDDNGCEFDAGDHNDRADDGRAGLELLGDRLADAGGSLDVVPAGATGRRVIAHIGLPTAATAS